MTGLSRMPNGALLVVERARGPVYYAKWRDRRGSQVKRALGPAWVTRDGDVWRRRRGRAPEGALDERAAVLAMAAAMNEHDAALDEEPRDRHATFADAAERWLQHLEHVEGAKPSTIADYRYYLAPANARPRQRGQLPAARIMRAFGHRPIASITGPEIARFLARLDAEPSLGPRTVNKHRQVLCSVFRHAMRDDTIALAANTAATTDKRREPDDTPIDFYESEEVLALARAASDGRHRDPRRPAVTAEEVAERARADEQDAALFVVAAFSGLRLGELLALRWRNGHFSDAKLIVEASWTAGQQTSPKSHNWRAVPLAGQPTAALAGLAARERFAGRHDLRLLRCGWRLPRSIRAAPALPPRPARGGPSPTALPRPAHSFGSLVIREFDPVAVKDFMGHSKITTTERYLHARSRRTDAARMTKAFAGDGIETEVHA